MAVWNVIGHQELSGGASSVSFSSIAADYDHLYLLSSTRSDESTVNSYLNFQVNGDTGSNYTRRAINFNSTSPNSPTGDGGSVWIYQWLPGGSAPSDTFGICETYFLNYANTDGYKQILSTGTNASGSTTASEYGARFSGGVWESTAAINRVDVIQESGDDFVQYSTFTLYGINGAG